MDVNGITRCNADRSQTIPKSLVLALQKRKGRTEWLVSLRAASLTVKTHSQWVSTCLDKWFTWNTQCSGARTFIHMALTRTASCGQSSNMFSLHLWHMKPYGIIYPLGRDHFQTGRFSDTIISCGVLDQEQAETGRKQKRAYVVLKGHVKNFPFLNHLSIWSFFFFKKKDCLLSLSLMSSCCMGCFSLHPFLRWVIMAREGYRLPLGLGLIRASRQVRDLLETIWFRSNCGKPCSQTCGPRTGTQP